MKRIANKWHTPQWLVKWHHAQLLANLYPVSFGILCYFLLVFLPRDVLTQHPQLMGFVNLVSSLVPSIAAFSDNVSQESVRFVYSLSWAMLPFWTFAYPWKAMIHRKKVFRSSKEEVRWLRAAWGVNLMNRFIAIFMPILTVLMMWLCWSGYPVLGGSSDLLAPISFVSSFSIALLIFIFSQGFLLGLWMTVGAIYRYPLLFKFAFSRKSK